jgi:hypothetical protein
MIVDGDRFGLLKSDAHRQQLHVSNPAQKKEGNDYEVGLQEIFLYRCPSRIPSLYPIELATRHHVYKNTPS